MLRKVSQTTSARLKGGGGRFGWMLGIPIMFASQAAFAENMTLDVMVSGDGVINSTPAGIECGNGATMCSMDVGMGTMVDLVAVPGTDMVVNWTSGCPTGSTTVCAVSVDAATSVTAEFTTMGDPGTGDTETPGEEAARRMPPVLFGLTLPPEGLVSGSEVTINWSLLGYHSNYNSAMALFDCSNVDMGECGKYYKDHFETSGKITSTMVEETTWAYGDIPGREHMFSHTFTVPDFQDATEIVLRFYRINTDDDSAGNQSISLLVPGGLQDVDYYDTSGRRVRVMAGPAAPVGN